MAEAAMLHRLSMTRTKSDTQKRKTISPQEYAYLVDAYSKCSAAETVFPGAHFGNLAKYLMQAFERRRSIAPCAATNAEESRPAASFVTLYNLSSGDTNGAVHFTQATHLNDFDLNTNTDLHGRLLFIRGNVTPEWLNVIGSKFCVDPEFFQRHLDFKRIVGRPDYFTLPTLPSAANYMTRFRLSTVGYIMRHNESRGVLEQRELDRTRERAEASWSAYLERLSRGREVDSQFGDSIVREFSVHDNNHISLEQDISVNVTYTGMKWNVIVWLDVGRNLSSNSEYPWSPQVLRVDPEEMSFHPTIQQHDRVSLHGRAYVSKTSLPEHESSNTRILQTASLLHLDYTRRLETDATSGGPLLVLLDVLRLSASSEVQFLNMIETKINTELSPVKSRIQDEPTVTNLLYHKQVLHRHVQRLSENINFIEYQISVHSMDRLEAAVVGQSRTKMSSILRDFEHLLGKAKDLMSECDRGMSIMMNKASIKEAQKAIIQAETITKLTKLAFIFIPLSFTSSFFGMNFSQFSADCSLGVWIWFVVSSPILMLSVIFMTWDMSQKSQQLRRWLTRKRPLAEPNLKDAGEWVNGKVVDNRQNHTV